MHSAWWFMSPKGKLGLVLDRFMNWGTTSGEKILAKSKRLYRYTTKSDTLKLRMRFWKPSQYKKCLPLLFFCPRFFPFQDGVQRGETPLGTSPSSPIAALSPAAAMLGFSPSKIGKQWLRCGGAHHHEASIEHVSTVGAVVGKCPAGKHQPPIVGVISNRYLVW